VTLSRASSYAIHALVYIALRKDGLPLTSRVIAAACGIPERFLLKLLQPLASRGILRSARGPGGGFVMQRAASEVTLLDVIETVDGPIGPAPPGDAGNNPIVNAVLGDACQEATMLLRKAMGKRSLMDLVRAVRKAKA
jgi:Rrf2 family protein